MALSRQRQIVADGFRRAKASYDTGVEEYNGAKEHYILDTDNTELLMAVVGILEPKIPLPKPRKKRQA